MDLSLFSPCSQHAREQLRMGVPVPTHCPGMAQSTALTCSTCLSELALGVPGTIPLMQGDIFYHGLQKTQDCMNFCIKRSGCEHRDIFFKCSV